MEEQIEVFESNITRLNNTSKNNLYDLLDIIPAEPVRKRNVQNVLCGFIPNNGKFYKPKKYNYKAKVRTIRDIRIQFEIDEYEWLDDYLEKQQRTLLKKIRNGQSNNEDTKILGTKLINSDKPITRDTWQMLININPESHKFPVQFIKWNGRRIKVNGSKGGSKRLIHDFDLLTQKTPLRKFSPSPHSKSSLRKRSLLQQSLAVKFKPGPKRFKSVLDESYQKHNFGDVDLVKLPKIALEITPKPHFVLDPNIRNFLQNLQSSDGQISPKLAKFAVSTVKSKYEVPDTPRPESLIFDLNYEYDQRKILMRHDINSSITCEDIPEYNASNTLYVPQDDTNVKIEVEHILDKIIRAVEISINEDDLYTGIDEPRETPIVNNLNNTPFPKEKQKSCKKRFCELNRLDVTVITLPENTDTDELKTCSESYCSYGCVCSSLHNKHNLKLHCGRFDCMFKCNCDYSNFLLDGKIENKCPELISGLFHLENKLNSTLAKEEQKFHQTVIFTEDKSVLFKSQKRNGKIPKRHNYDKDSMSLKDNKEVRSFTVIATKLNCDNVEPWCMIHNLYKCFCKGRFTIKALLNQDINTPLVNTKSKEALDNELNSDISPVYLDSSISDSNDTSDGIFAKQDTCARINPYNKRKYSIKYYTNLNNKIMLMEKNDKSLINKLYDILGIEISDEPRSLELDEGEFAKKQEKCYENFVSGKNTKRNRDFLSYEDNFVEKNKKTSASIPEKENSAKERDNEVNSEDQFKPELKSKLVAWLEFSYKQYKQNIEQGKTKITLIPPKAGKVALYPWEFILGRYKEKKNIFIVSRHKPFRIFMAVNTKDPLFNECNNINDIRYADLHNYPVTVKNLLTNVTDVKDNFCILRGMPHCWELVGSVTKVDNKCDESISNNRDNVSKFDYNNMTSETGKENEQFCFSDDDDNQGDPDARGADSSKWFIMTLENDFNEIQFHKRGFFVKFESIVKAIHVARASNKTVRLSSKKCLNKNSEAQFGIYAIPNANEYCVFIGPYEKNESLGIKTVNNSNYNVNDEKTRGIWITTKKVDNLKVIDNPLLFLPSANCLNKMLPLQEECMTFPTDNTLSKNVPETNVCSTKLNIDTETMKQTFEKSNILETSKVSNDEISPTPVESSSLQQRSRRHKYYEYVPGITNSLLKINLDTETMEPQHVFQRDISSESPSCSNAKKYFIDKRNPNCVKPVAEIAPQIKISSIHSLKEFPSDPAGSRMGGMLILKPEQINERLITNTAASKNQVKSSDQEINRDIENFLANSAACSPPNDDILIVSEDDIEDDQTLVEDIFILCKNIESLGWIPGKRNSENKISFQFPGFKFTDYYDESEVFQKIYQVLARKIYVPPHISLDWEIVETLKDVKSHELQSEELTPDMVLTKKGLKHKNALIVSTIRNKKNNVLLPTTNKSEKWTDKGMTLEQFEAKSKVLEDHGQNLLNKTVDKRTEILASLSTASADLRSEIAERLKSIIGYNQN